MPKNLPGEFTKIKQFFLSFSSRGYLTLQARFLLVFRAFIKKFFWSYFCFTVVILYNNMQLIWSLYSLKFECNHYSFTLYCFLLNFILPVCNLLCYKQFLYFYHLAIQLLDTVIPVLLLDRFIFDNKKRPPKGDPLYWFTIIADYPLFSCRPILWALPFPTGKQSE